MLGLDTRRGSPPVVVIHNGRDQRRPPTRRGNAGGKPLSRKDEPAQQAPDQALLGGAGGARTRDQRITDPRVSTVPGAAHNPLEQNVIGVRHLPVESRRFPAILGHIGGIKDG